MGFRPSQCFSLCLRASETFPAPPFPRQFLVGRVFLLQSRAPPACSALPALVYVCFTLFCLRDSCTFGRTYRDFRCHLLLHPCSAATPAPAPCSLRWVLLLLQCLRSVMTSRDIKCLTEPLSPPQHTHTHTRTHTHTHHKCTYTSACARMHVIYIAPFFCA
jgi:hypothetical protein